MNFRNLFSTYWERMTFLIHTVSCRLETLRTVSLFFFVCLAVSLIISVWFNVAMSFICLLLCTALFLKVRPGKCALFDMDTLKGIMDERMRIKEAENRLEEVEVFHHHSTV